MKYILVILSGLLTLNLAQADTLFSCQDLAGNRRTIAADLDKKTDTFLYFLNNSNFRAKKSTRVFFGDSSEQNLSVTESNEEFKIERIDTYKFITSIKSHIVNKKTGSAVYEYVKKTEAYTDVIRRDSLHKCTDRRN